MKYHLVTPYQSIHGHNVKMAEIALLPVALLRYHISRIKSRKKLFSRHSISQRDTRQCLGG